jgi:hypothetical protein
LEFVKAALRIVAWLMLATIVLAWRAGPISFQQRWVSMPPAMSWEMLARARQAAERPAAMTYCKYPDCKRS